MPKNEDKLVSESEHDGMSMEDAINGSFRDILAGLCNVQKAC